MTIRVALVGTRGTSATGTVATGSGTSTGGANSTGLVVISHDPGTTITSVTDNKGNTWTLLGSVTGGAKLARYICLGMAGGAAHVVTAVFSATAFATIHHAEIIGSVGAITRDAIGSVATTNIQFASEATYTATSGTLAQANSLVVCALEQNSGTVGAYAFSPQTLLSQEPDVGNFWTSGIATQVVVPTTAVTTNVTRTGSTPSTSAIFIDVFKEAVGGTPNITGVSTATPVVGSQLVITGTGFGATQGAQTVTVGGTVCQVVSWSDTAVTVIVGLGINKYGASLNTIITGSNTFAGITGLIPSSGFSFLNMTTPNVDPTIRIQTTPDFISGDQLVWDGKGGKVLINADGTFSVTPDVISFQLALWTSPDGYGAFGTQTIGQGNVILWSVAPLAGNDVWLRDPSLIQTGAVTHTSTGALVGQGSSLSGAANHSTLHASTGVLTGQGSTTSGAAKRFRQFLSSGALIGQGSTMNGAAARAATPVTHASTGVLTGQGSTTAGAATRFRAFSSSGTLVGQGSTTSGAATRFRTFASSGALVGQGSTVAGTAARFRAFLSSGSLTGQGSNISGSAARTGAFISHDATGALQGQGSLTAGVSNRFTSHNSSGLLIGQGSTIAGSATLVKTHTSSGALVGAGSSLSGSATNKSGSGGEPFNYHRTYRRKSKR